MEPRHGHQGWNLVRYSWSETTGVATFHYERRTSAGVQTHATSRAQPSCPEHAGWPLMN